MSGNGIDGAKGCGYAYLHHALDDHSRLAYSETTGADPDRLAGGELLDAGHGGGQVHRGGAAGRPQHVRDVGREADEVA